MNKLNWKREMIENLEINKWVKQMTFKIYIGIFNILLKFSRFIKFKLFVRNSFHNLKCG